MSATWWKDPNDLIPEQSDILDILEDKSIFIQGPPGSGKTNLLLLRANQLNLGEYPNLYVVVFGSLLKSFIQIGGGNYDFPESKIITHTRLFIEILRSEGVTIDTSGMKIMDARNARADALDALIKDGKVGAQFDALLLDEAQDYTEQEILVLRRLTKILVGAGDHRQSIYNVGGDPVKILSQCVDDVYVLKYHFRNGRDICRVADGINKGKPDYVPILSTSNYNESSNPSRVTIKDGLTLLQQAEVMAEQIQNQLFAYPDELVGVLCPVNADLDFIEEKLSSLGYADKITRANSKEDFDPSRPIWLSTLSAAKGLEFRSVHIAGLDNLYKTREAQKRLIFTGVTRAKTSLTMYWHKNIPGYLEAAVVDFRPQKGPVTLNQIFGKK